MIITYMTDGAELHLTTLLLRLGFPYGRDVVRPPTQSGDGWGTTTITAALAGEERRAIQLFAATAHGATIQEESAEDSRPARAAPIPTGGQGATLCTQ